LIATESSTNRNVNALNTNNKVTNNRSGIGSVERSIVNSHAHNTKR